MFGGWGAYLTHPLNTSKHLGEFLVVFLEGNPHMGNAVIHDLPRGKSVVIPDYNAVSRPVTRTRRRDSDELLFCPFVHIAVFVKGFLFYLEFLLKGRNAFVKIDERRPCFLGSVRPFPHIRNGCIRLAGLAWQGKFFILRPRLVASDPPGIPAISLGQRTSG